MGRKKSELTKILEHTYIVDYDDTTCWLFSSNMDVINKLKRVKGCRIVQTLEDSRKKKDKFIGNVFMFNKFPDKVYNQVMKLCNLPYSETEDKNKEIIKKLRKK